MTKILFLFYWIEIGVWLIGVEDFVAVHYCYKVFGVREVDDVVSVARKHDDTLDFITTHFIVQYFVGTLFTELDESVTANNDKLFPFSVVPMLTFGDARF